MSRAKMPKPHTHYDNLKVPRNAPVEAIKTAYKSLAQKHHPDRNPGNPDATRIMAILNMSYEVLCDPQKRALHDQWISQEEEPATVMWPRSETIFPGPTETATSSRQGQKSKAQLVFGLIFCLLFSFGGLIFVTKAAKSVVFDIYCKEVPGVLEARYTKETTRVAFAWFSIYKVSYSYIVNGHVYKGKHTLWLEPKNQNLPVYYHPDNPANSRLSLGMYFQEFLYSLFALGMAWLFFIMFKNQTKRI